MNNEKLSVGIIGAGYWGPNLVRNFSSNAMTRCLAVCDANPVRLEKIGQQFSHVKLVSSVDQLLELPIDAVAIATPVSTHFKLAKQCLESGKHVLVEKPLTATARESKMLMEIAARNGKVLMVDHTYLFNPAIKRIKQIVDSGELGDLYYIDSVRINLGLFQHDVNVVWDLAPHDLSIVDYVVGMNPRSISAWGCAHANPDIEDIAYVNVDYGDQLLANFHVNWLSPVKIRQMIFAGSRKSIIFNELNTTEPVKVYDRGIDLPEEGPTDEQRRKLMVEYRSGDCWSPHIEPGEALAAAVTHFATCIRDGLTPISDGSLGHRVVQMLESANRSIRAQGGRVVFGQGDQKAERYGENRNGNGKPAYANGAAPGASAVRSGEVLAHRA